MKALKVQSVISSVFVRMWPRMFGMTTSRSCCQPVAPAIRALSICDGGTADSADENSSIENAVPTQMLNTMIVTIGYSISHAMPSVPKTSLTVPERRSSNAIHRNEATDAGITQAASTSVSTSSSPSR